MRDTATELNQPGMVVLVRTPEGESVNAYGATEWKGTTPVGLDTKFRIGTATKTMTATAIRQTVPVNRVPIVAWGNLAPVANGFPPAEALVAGLLPHIHT